MAFHSSGTTESPSSTAFISMHSTKSRGASENTHATIGTDRYRLAACSVILTTCETYIGFGRHDYYSNSHDSHPELYMSENYPTFCKMDYRQGVVAVGSTPDPDGRRQV